MLMFMSIILPLQYLICNTLLTVSPKPSNINSEVPEAYHLIFAMISSNMTMVLFAWYLRNILIKWYMATNTYLVNIHQNNTNHLWTKETTLDYILPNCYILMVFRNTNPLLVPFSGMLQLDALVLPHISRLCLAFVPPPSRSP